MTATRTFLVRDNHKLAILQLQETLTQIPTLITLSTIIALQDILIQLLKQKTMIEIVLIAWVKHLKIVMIRTTTMEQQARTTQNYLLL